MPLFGPLATDAAARQRRPMLSRLSSVSSALPSRSASVAASLPLDRTSTLSESADFATADAALPTPLATFYDADPLPAATPVQPSEDVAVRSVSCAPAARLLAVVLQDGRVALVSLPEGGLSAANQARLVRWIYKPTSPAFAAVAAAVQPSGHFVAVGLAHGRVAMYSMAGILSAGKVGSHGSLATPRTSFDSVGSAGAGDGGVRKLHAGLPEPDRIFSLTEWGYSSSLIGAAHLLQWSPDGRVVAVGYARRGVAVWTPSGCRVMCSLRQAAQGMAGPGLGDYAERRELSDGLEVDLESVVGSPSGLNPQHNKPAAEAGVLEVRAPWYHPP